MPQAGDYIQAVYPKLERFYGDHVTRTVTSGPTYMPFAEIASTMFPDVNGWNAEMPTRRTEWKICTSSARRLVDERPARIRRSAPRDRLGRDSTVLSQ